MDGTRTDTGHTPRCTGVGPASGLPKEPLEQYFYTTVATLGGPTALAGIGSLI